MAKCLCSAGPGIAIPVVRCFAPTFGSPCFVRVSIFIIPSLLPPTVISLYLWLLGLLSTGLFTLFAIVLLLGLRARFGISMTFAPSTPPSSPSASAPPSCFLGFQVQLLLPGDVVFLSLEAQRMRNNKTPVVIVGCSLRGFASMPSKIAEIFVYKDVHIDS